jgi:hypothetical protein
MHQARSRSLAARIAALETELVELRQQQRTELVVTIAAVIGPGVAFSARELWEHRVISPALASVLAELGLTSARQLGKKLRQLGLERVGVDEHGAVWLVG